MKHGTRLFWLCFSIFFLLLARCNGDDGPGASDAQSDVSTKDSSVDAAPDVATDAASSDAPIDVSPDVATTTFNVTAAAAINATKITVTFDAPPDATEATTLSHYNVPSLQLSGTPSLNGSTVTITTAAQTATSYTMTVTGVTRASDSKPLTIAAASFTGRTPFDVTAATSVDSVTMTVTFDALPTTTQATTLANYSVNGLGLSGTPQLAGNTVTITTNGQGAGPYTVTVSNVTRASDGEPLLVNQAQFAGTPTFNVSSAMATGNTLVQVTFDAAPESNSATTLANYSISGLVLSGTPSLKGNTVTITTSAQIATTYTVDVENVVRGSDSSPLVNHQATFAGRTSFNVSSALDVSATSFSVTFDAPPDPTAATTLANYTVSGLNLSGTPVLNGNTVTITSDVQTATQYEVDVSGVKRNSDGEPLTVTSANFNGRTPFNVSQAASTSAVTMTVTFDAPPNPSQATTLANYSVATLAITGTPVLAGNTVTILTAAQTATSYTVTVSNVTRLSDAEPLTTNQATFTGTAVQAPTVTNVVVNSTSPNNGATPYNTGTSTVKITGTDLTTVTCPTGVKLDDLDGANVAVGTQPTSCSVDSDTQITATFPSGIRTNASTGWNVLVTNSVGSNATSAVRFVPLAGLLISEISTASASGTNAASREFVELYNPTGTTIDTGSIKLTLWTRSSTGTEAHKPITLFGTSTGVVPSHGFLMIMSTNSVNTDAWYSHGDYTYTSSSGTLVDGGSVYLSLSTGAVAEQLVIDKVGWGAQPANGYEGTALATNIPAGDSVERKPAGGQGDATDTDVNSSDFNAPSATLTPKGTADTIEP